MHCVGRAGYIRGISLKAAYKMTMLQKDKEYRNDKNFLEWTVFTISLLLVLGIILYLSYEVYTEKPSTPDLYVEYKQDPSEHAANRYHITVKNDGGETAEEVHVELSMEKAGAEIEVAQLQIPFSPKKSKREGWITFKNDPSKADTIVARVVSYKKP